MKKSDAGVDSLPEIYDNIYAHDAVPAGEGEADAPAGLEPLHLSGWPRGGREALLFLARPGGRLLDIGCGRGEVLNALAGQYDAAVGVELSPVRAEHARQALRQHRNCHIVAGGLEALAAEQPDPFDCIVWNDVIEHVIDVMGAMRTLASLSHAGTQLVTVTPNIAFYPHRWRALRGRAPTSSVLALPNDGFAPTPAETLLLDAGHVHYFTFAQVERLYRLHGFVPQRRLGLASRWSRPRNLWPTLLSSLVCVSGTFRPQEGRA